MSTNKPKRLASSLQLITIQIKSHKKFYSLITLTLISIFYLLSSLLSPSLAPGVTEGIHEHEGIGKLPKFDREREEDGLNGKIKFPALDELIDRDRLWPPNLDKPLCDLKVYIYPLPPSLSLTTSQINQCRWSAYSSELTLYSLLTSSSTTDIPSKLVTNDPTQADIFFIPLFPACYLFNCWVKAGWNRKGRCGVDEDLIQPVMKLIKEQPYWSRKGGGDHLLVHPMDFIDGYYTEESRLAMNSSIHLVTVGDLRPPPFSQHYRRFRDIVIPSSTHLLNAYYINPRDFVDEFGNPLVDRIIPKVEPKKSSIWEPSESQKKIVWWEKPKDYLKRTESNKNIRTTTAIFRGGIGEPNEGESYSLSIRTLFFPTPNTTHPSKSHLGFSSLSHFDIAISSENIPYAQALSLSKFGLVPPGYTLDTTRIWEYLAFGVVPVFIGTGPSAGEIMPFMNDFDYSSFSIFIPRHQAHLVPEILEKVSEKDYERLRKAVWEVGRLLVLEEGRGNVWNWIGRDLCRITGKGSGAGEKTDWF